MKLLATILCSLAAITAVSCSPVASTTKADKAVAKFHDLYNDSEFEAIYSASHPDFQAVQPKDTALKFFASVREKLGEVESSSRTGWNASSVNLKTNITLTFATEFENGSAMESFSYQIKDDTATLCGWNLNSDDLVTAPLGTTDSGASELAQDPDPEPEP